MDSKDLLTDAFGRVQEEVHGAVEGLSAEDLNEQVEEGTNSIAWLVWHLTRIQDDHVSGVAGTEQVWTSQEWEGRFGLPFPKTATGYGHGAEQVAQTRVDSPELLLGYYDAVHERTLRYLEGLDDEALDQVVDERWTPAVTLGVRLVSVLGDDSQHVGQAALVRGLLERR